MSDVRSNISDETRKILSKSLKGHKVSKETRQKLSKAAIGKNNPFYGKKHSEETKQKMSAAHRDTWVNKNKERNK